MDFERHLISELFKIYATVHLLLSLQIYDPTELERSHLTLEDNRIKITDIPERFQLRAVPIQQVSNTELEEEAEWIYKQAFMQPPISQQNFQVMNSEF